MNGKRAKALRKQATYYHNMNPQFKLKVLYKLLKGHSQKKDVMGE